MQRRTFALLVAGAAVSAGAASVVLAIGDRASRSTANGERVLLALADKLANLGRMHLSRGAMTINFTLTAGRWVVVEKGNYPAAEDRIRKLLVGLAELELIEPKTDKAELLPRLDLDDPANGKSTLVTLQDRIGAIVGEVIIGRNRPSRVGGDAGVYVRRPNTDQAWLARGSVDLSGDVLAWLDRRIIDIPAERVASIVLTTPDGTPTVLSRSAPAAAFAVEGASTAPDASQLAAVADVLTALDLDDVKLRAEQPIPQDGAATAAFTTFDGLIIGARLSSPGGADWLALTATGSAAQAEPAKALNDRLAPWSFAIPAERAKLLRATLADLQSPHGS
jgi:hypothetical protein